jgi:hypothetical protein
VSAVIITFVFNDVFIVLNERIVVAELLRIVVHYLRRETLLRVSVTCTEDLDGLPLLSVESGGGSDWVLLPW